MCPASMADGRTASTLRPRRPKRVIRAHTWSASNINHVYTTTQSVVFARTSAASGSFPSNGFFFFKMYKFPLTKLVTVRRHRSENNTNNNVLQWRRGLLFCRSSECMARGARRIAYIIHSPYIIIIMLLQCEMILFVRRTYLPRPRWL